MLQSLSQDVNSQQYQSVNNAQVRQDEATGLPNPNLNVDQTKQSVNPATTSPIQIALLQDGYSPVSIVVAISIVIGAIASLIKVLVPVMLHKRLSNSN